MIYSIQKPDFSYQYFDGQGDFPPTGQFRRPRGQPINGLFPPAQYLPTLPSGTVPVGEGKEARGVVAVHPTSMMAGLPEPVKRWAPPVLLGVLIGYLVRGWRKK